jgi:hypothetical protein
MPAAVARLLSTVDDSYIVLVSLGVFISQCQELKMQCVSVEPQGA